jgi:ribosome recycling factor
MANVDDLLEETEMKMMAALEAFEKALAGFRTGKASPGLVENLTIEVYGTQTRLRDVAGITTPEPRLLVVQPWDQNTLGAIEKAIMASDIGISPLNDGRVIRLPIPELSEERRADLTKQMRGRCEDARVEIRNHRREANDAAKKAQKSADITEDDLREMLEEVQTLTDDYIKQIDAAADAKEEELMQI